MMIEEPFKIAPQTVDTLNAILSAKEARILMLESALKPFADVRSRMLPMLPFSPMIVVGAERGDAVGDFTLGDLRAAHAAYHGGKG